MIINIENHLKSERTKSNVSIILCQHAHPKTPKKYIQGLKNQKWNIKAFFWGHFHSVSLDFVKKIKTYGLYQNIMPEMNNYKHLIIDI